MFGLASRGFDAMVSEEQGAQHSSILVEDNWHCGTI
jgi:hypothetical protein